MSKKKEEIETTDEKLNDAEISKKTSEKKNVCQDWDKAIVSKKFRVMFLEKGCLGTYSADPEITREHILSKKGSLQVSEEVANKTIAALPSVEFPPAEEGYESLDEEVRQQTTVFCRGEDGNPIMWDYQIRGFFKEAQSCLNRIPNSPCSMSAFKKIIDGNVFVFPCQLKIHMSGPLVICERPIRVSGPRGERVAIARSEEVPGGSYIEVEVQTLGDLYMKYVIQWMKYGRLKGLGQWRNSGKGSFKFTELS